MGVGYRVFEALGVLYVRYEGLHNIRTTDQLYRLYGEDPDVRKGLICLQDCSKITKAQLDVEARRRQVARFRARLKDPERDWQVVYYCPTRLSRSLTEMQRMLWQGRDGVQFQMADSPVRLADILRQPLSTVEQMLVSDVITAQRHPTGLSAR